MDNANDTMLATEVEEIIWSDLESKYITEALEILSLASFLNPDLKNSTYMIEKTLY